MGDITHFLATLLLPQALSVYACQAGYLHLCENL